MTIRRHDGPIDGRQVLGAALAARSHRVAVLPPLGGAPQTASPIPIYHIGLDQASGPDPLQFATLTGWRFPVIGGVSAGLAHITVRPTGSVFEGLSHGIAAQRLIQAGYLAEQSLGARQEEYEPRLLDIPALLIFALWLKGPTDYFIVLLDGDPPGSAPLVMIDDIRPRITQALQARSGPMPQGVPQRPAGGAPTN